MTTSSDQHWCASAIALSAATAAVMFLLNHGIVRLTTTNAVAAGVLSGVAAIIVVRWAVGEHGIQRVVWLLIATALLINAIGCLYAAPQI